MVSVACLSSVKLSRLLQEEPAALETAGLAGLTGAELSEALLRVCHSPSFLSLSLMLSNTHSYNTVPILPSPPKLSH